MFMQSVASFRPRTRLTHVWATERRPLAYWQVRACTQLMYWPLWQAYLALWQVYAEGACHWYLSRAPVRHVTTQPWPILVARQSAVLLTSLWRHISAIQLKSGMSPSSPSHWFQLKMKETCYQCDRFEWLTSSWMRHELFELLTMPVDSQRTRTAATWL